MPLSPADYRKTRFTHRRGIAADRPAAADVLPGTLYFSTDTNILERSTGSSWESYSGTGNGNVTTGVTLTANRVILGNGTSDVAVLGSLGTTTTVLHGNAAGAPTFGAVSLSADVTGDLAVSSLSNGTHIVVSSTATGAQNDWAPGLDGNTVIVWSGASDITISGFAGGVAGQRIVFKNVSSASIAYFKHQDAGSSAANRLRNMATGGDTPVNIDGTVEFQYETTNSRWQMVAHEQGKPITPVFASGDFSGTGSMTWTVDSGDVLVDAYVISGKRVAYQFYYVTTTVGGTPSVSLRRALSGILVPAESDANVQWSRNLDNGTPNDGFAFVGSAFGNFIFIRADKTSPNWTASTNNTEVQGFLVWELG